MKTIKINFTDVPNEFNVKNNFIVNILKQRFNVQFAEDPDFLFYSNFGTSFLKYKDSVKIFFSGEPVVANFNDCDYAIDYCRLTFGDRHFRAANLLGNIGNPVDRSIQERKNVTHKLLDRKFCNFIYSNDKNGSGAILRKEFCKQLMKYKNVDCAGQVLNNMKKERNLAERYERTLFNGYEVRNENWAESKIKFLGEYKFTIAFENTPFDGFATEKIFHPLRAASIPIYWGDPNITKDFNPKAFINCREYDNNFEKIIEKIIELDNDDEKYLEMLRQPPIKNENLFCETEAFIEYLNMIIERGKVPFEKNSLGFISVASTSFEEHCRLGHVGMRTILKSGVNWFKYKMSRN